MAKKTGGSVPAWRWRRHEGFEGGGEKAALEAIPGGADTGRWVFPRRLRPALATVPLAFIGFIAPNVALAASNIVTITRDGDGVAHITAANFTALGYGEAWAFSQDSFCTLANDFITLKGERSLYFGPGAANVDYGTGSEDSNLDSDLYWQAVKAGGVVQTEMSEPPPNGPLPQVMQLYRGFVAGYNAYLASGQLNDPSCAG